MSYAFLKMTATDLSLVRSWLATPEVARWWQGEIDEADLADSGSRQWIVYHQDRPFAFVQDYDPHIQENHPFAFLPKGARGIDQFIGRPDMLDQGHGSAFIHAFTDMLFMDGAPIVGTDPHPDNIRAVRACEKAGFERDGVCEAEWGICLLMTRRRP